jgi:hypothetical protein
VDTSAGEELARADFLVSKACHMWWRMIVEMRWMRSFGELERAQAVGAITAPTS